MHNYGSAPLARQIDYVFRQLETELTHASAGTVLIHIRNNTVGKYGIRHNPIELKKHSTTLPLKGLTSAQVHEFRAMAVEALKYKKNWTHGEIMYDFSVRQGSASSWSASMLCESNYNLASSPYRFEPKHPMSRELREAVEE